MKKKLKVLPRALFGNRILRTKAQKVSTQEIRSKRIQDLIRGMRYTLSKVGGVGIAAPQLGESLQLSIVAIPEDRSDRELRLVVCNPKITHYGKKSVRDWEGCLSLPGVRGKVPRSQTVEVSWVDENGKKQQGVFHGFEARVFQHEIDHLHGILYVDRMDDMKTLISVEEYNKLLQKKEKKKKS